MHDDDLRQRLLDTFRWFDPGLESSHLVSDTSGWWRDADLLARLGPALAAPYADAHPTVVVSPEVSGFLLGPLVARELGVGFVGVFRDGVRQRAGDTLVRATPPDHRGESVTLRMPARLGPGDRVLVVDDWVETGAQLHAIRALVEQAGATYLGTTVVVDGADTRTRAGLSIRGLLARAEL